MSPLSVVTLFDVTRDRTHGHVNKSGPPGVTTTKDVKNPVQVVIYVLVRMYGYVYMYVS